MNSGHRWICKSLGTLKIFQRHKGIGTRHLVLILVILFGLLEVCSSSVVGEWFVCEDVSESLLRVWEDWSFG